MLNENYLTMTEGTGRFLEDLGLGQYYEIFIARGYDSETDICNLQERDLEALAITDQRHRQLLLTAAKHHSPSEEARLYQWLTENRLDHYFVGFLNTELADFATISNLTLPDEKVYDELEITLPGHKRRLERAVHQLRKRRRFAMEAEEPLAYGYWGQPDALHDAKYEFLCLKADIVSTRNFENKRTVDFMVDSGSDVVTLRSEVLESLDLELLGTVRSKGVHASKQKQLFKAKLVIGSEELEIEVMAETYDSLGSRVIRHFRHYIDGTKHIWLKGNYLDPTMAQVSAIPTIQSVPSMSQVVPSLPVDPPSKSPELSESQSTSSSAQPSQSQLLPPKFDSTSLELQASSSELSTITKSSQSTTPQLTDEAVEVTPVEEVCQTTEHSIS